MQTNYSQVNGSVLLPPPPLLDAMTHNAY
jgi:hypothetical protein